MARKSAEKYPGQRGKEKRAFFRQYQLRIIEDLYKHRFFALFGHRCFKCGKPEKAKQEISAPPHLCMDHHIPMALGGHFVAGNLVSLCRQCNGLKLDKAPTDFYSTQELERLQTMLAAQQALFAFAFDGVRWMKDREAYLLDMGIDKAIVHAALHDEYFHGYVGAAADDPVGITITFDTGQIAEVIRQVKNSNN